MTTRAPIKLIINADDYGYFPCVSQGILSAAKSGALTATGILANSPHLQKQLAELDAVKNLEVGIHLNLTFKHPLTAAMSEKLANFDGFFPTVFKMTGLILEGKITRQDVRAEWRAQIEVCQQGRTLSFLNSHEHIHMLPSLFPLALELAQEYKIPYVRLTRAEQLFSASMAGIIRNTLMQAMALINQYRFKTPTPLFLGLSASGKLNYNYLESLFSRLQPGKAYELMCHPGYFESAEITDARLMAYHDWEGELQLLQSTQLQTLYKKFGIQLSHYHDLTF